MSWELVSIFSCSCFFADLLFEVLLCPDFLRYNFCLATFAKCHIFLFFLFVGSFWIVGLGFAISHFCSLYYGVRVQFLRKPNNSLHEIFFWLFVCTFIWLAQPITATKEKSFRRRRRSIFFLTNFFLFILWLESHKRFYRLWTRYSLCLCIVAKLITNLVKQKRQQHILYTNAFRHRVKLSGWLFTSIFNLYNNERHVFYWISWFRFIPFIIITNSFARQASQQQHKDRSVAARWQTIKILE